MSEELLKRIDEMLAQRIGTLEESLGDKLDLLAEGQQMLSERIEATRTELKDNIAKVDHRLTVVEARLDQQIGGAEKKVDGIAADLKAHRNDTEAHHKGWCGKSARRDLCGGCRVTGIPTATPRDPHIVVSHFFDRNIRCLKT